MNDKRPVVDKADVKIKSGIGIHDKTGKAKISNATVKVDGAVGIGIAIGEIPEDIQQEIDALKKPKKKHWLIEHFWLPLIVGVIVVSIAIFFLQPWQQNIQSDNKKTQQEKQTLKN